MRGECALSRHILNSKREHDEAVTRYTIKDIIMKTSNIKGLAIFGGALIFAYQLSAYETTVEVDGVEYEVQEYQELDRIRYRIYHVPEDTSGSIVIPSKIGVYSVSAIGGRAFGGCTNLTSVTIPDGVTIIEDGYSTATASTSDYYPYGGGAFAGCSSLTNVTIPSSVTSVGTSAFRGCSGLTSVTIPDGVTSIGASAFSGCSSLTSVNIADLAAWCKMLVGGAEGNPLCYAKNLYLNGNKVTDLTIPDGMTSIGNYAFYGFGGLTSVTIPDSVASIGDYAFANCTNLASVVIGSNVTNIGYWAFKGCSNLQNVTIPNGVSSIGWRDYHYQSSVPVLTSFLGCDKLWSRIISMTSNYAASSVVTTTVCQVVTTVVQQVESPYGLSKTAADRAIASMSVSGDCAIDAFVLKDGVVYDTMLRIVNTADSEVKLTLPTGYSYETFKGVKPLTIPAKSKSLLSITRVADKTFLVSREDLEDVK